MLTRREFLRLSSVATAGIATFGLPKVSLAAEDVVSRPEVSKRNFTSSAVEAKIQEIKAKMADKELARLFENCYPNTLDTTVKYRMQDGRPDTFVITGDIEAMWLRDSSAQVYPYLPLVNKDKKLKDLITGVINRQVKCILIDPYANAFNDGPADSPWKTDITDMKPELHERKWEIDSLCYPVRLAYSFWKTTGDSLFFSADWKKAVQMIIATFRTQQRKTDKGPYQFKRETSWHTDTVAGNGFGNPIKPNGLIVSVFRPSDDSTIYPFLIPSNFFAVVSLRQISEIADKVYNDSALASEALGLAEEVEKALREYAVSEHLNFGKVYAYEVDGFGNSLFMDDANAPNLLSLSYLGCVSADDEIYKNTRRFILSQNNPYYFKGKFEGIGSPHTLTDKIWHIGVIMRALTSHDDNEITDCLSTLKNTHAGKYFMHESFNKDNPADFTRPWFAWANTLFGELIIRLSEERPHLMKKIF